MSEPTQPQANNPEGEGTTPAAEPTAEPTTEAPEEEVREDSNPSNGKPETVPYDTFAETRRENREYKQKIAEYERVLGGAGGAISPAPGRTVEPPQSGNNRVPDEFILEDGSVDIHRYTDWIRSGIPDPNKISDAVVEKINRQNTLREMNQREETELFGAYPDVQNDPEKRRLVEAVRNQSLIDGEYISRKQAADMVFGLANAAAANARKQVTETREIQANNAAPPAPAKVDEKAAAAADLQRRLEDPNPSVREAARLELFKSQIPD